MMKKQIGGGITYKNPKGFTLIELLAVIVILAVIALILTPIVSGIIKTAKKNAFESTGYGILESTKLYYSKKVGELESDLTFTCNNDTCTSDDEKLEFKGTINGSGTVLLFSDGNIALCLESSDYATVKNINDERLSTTEQGTCEFNDETKEYAVIGTVSAKLYEELQNEYNVLNTTHLELLENYNNGKELISNAITNKGIETSSDDTFEEMAENVTNISTGNPNLRYNDEDNQIQVLSTTGQWFNIYETSVLPLPYLKIANAGQAYIDTHLTTVVTKFIYRGSNLGYVPKLKIQSYSTTGGGYHSTLSLNINGQKFDYVSGTSYPLIIDVNKNVDSLEIYSSWGAAYGCTISWGEITITP